VGRIWGVVWAVLVVGFLACGGGPQESPGGPAVGALPAGGFAAGWSRSGAPTPIGAAELYQRIDGGAEVFLQEGFRQLLTAVYTDGTHELEASLYLMEDAEAARRVWERQGRGDGIVEGLPGPAVVDRYQLAVLLDCSILVVDNLSGGEQAVSAMVSLARSVGEGIPALCGGGTGTPSS